MDPEIVETSVPAGDGPFWLVSACLFSLEEQGLLAALKTGREVALWSSLEFTLAEDLPLLRIGESVYESLTEGELESLYHACGGRSCHHPLALNCWLRAWAPGADSFSRYHERVLNRYVVGSLLERGGSLFEALKLSSP
ncbi:MAG: hypothetical protein HQL31_04225 [Planctomycetes bacterium]|nr:hypothetical protein [Planctomycetota bacterium]